MICRWIISLKMKSKQTQDTLFLYVLLERINNLRIMVNGKDKDFKKILKSFEKFFSQDDEAKDKTNYWECELTKDAVLQAEIDKDLRNKDYKFGAETSTIPQQSSYKINGETLLHFAIRIPFKDDGSPIADNLTKIIELLIKRCPRLLKWPYRGLTPLQLAVVKGNKSIVDKMVDKFKEPKWNLKYPNETKVFYRGTKMMAATPLALAAVCNNRSVFKCLVKFEEGEKTLEDKNESGDNIYHSLIRHAHREKSSTVEQEVLKWFDYISNCEWRRENDLTSISTSERINSDDRSTSNMVPARQLWMMTNNEKLNPLQLAAKLGQYKLFEYIMSTPVYRVTESSDGLIDEEMYDITEIETLPIDNHDDMVDETTANPDLTKGIKRTSADTVDIQRDYHTSILEYVVNHDARTAFQFIRFSPMKGVLVGKWKTYQWVCIIWHILHMIFMGLLSYTAVARKSVLNDSPYQNGSTTTPEQASYVYTFSNDTTIRIATVCSILVGIIYLSIECFRLLSQRFRARMTRNMLKNVVKQFKNPYSNITFRVCFLIFSLTLIVDSCFAILQVQHYENYLTPFSLIIGWYLVLFFLQVWQPFSFFTVLIQRVIIDLIKFSIVMSFLLIAFSAAMFMVMQGAQHIDEDFTSFRRTAMKMLMVMIGLGDLDVLFTARSSLMAVIVFVLFVLLTTILLLNALIALMSNTCTELMSAQGNAPANRLHSYLQKLSMVMYLESFYIYRFIVVVGEIVPTPNRFLNDRWLMLKRRKWMKKILNTDEKSISWDDDNSASDNSKSRKKRSRRMRGHNVIDWGHLQLSQRLPQYMSTFTQTPRRSGRGNATIN